MRIVRDWQFVEQRDRGASAAIGNFDGVHRGHQAVIDIARAAAAKRGAPLGVMTFEPHPRQYFAPGGPAFRLMNAEARAHRLDWLGVEVLYELSFNDTLSALTPEEFARAKSLIAAQLPTRPRSQSDEAGLYLEMKMRAPAKAALCALCAAHAAPPERAALCALATRFGYRRGAARPATMRSQGQRPEAAG